MPKPITYHNSERLTPSEIAWLRQSEKEAQAYYQKELDRMEAEEAKAAASQAKTTTPKMTESADQSQAAGIQIPAPKADRSEES